MKKNSATARVSICRKVGFGLSGLVYSMVNTMFIALALYYGVVFLRLPAYLLGLLCFFALIIAVCSYPLLSYIINRNRSVLLGRYHGYFLASGVMISFANIFFFSLSPDYNIVYNCFAIFFSLLVMQLSMHFFQYSYFQIGNKVAGSQVERANIKRIELGFSMLGIIAVTMLAGILLENISDGFLELGYIVGSIVLICVIIAFFCSHIYVPLIYQREKNLPIGDKKTFTNIYKDYCKSLFGGAKIKSFLTLCLHELAICMALVGATVYAVMLYNMSVLIIFTCILICVLFVIAVYKISTNYFAKLPRKLLCNINLTLTCVLIGILVGLFIVLALAPIAKEYYSLVFVLVTIVVSLFVAITVTINFTIFNQDYRKVSSSRTSMFIVKRIAIMVCMAVAILLLSILLSIFQMANISSLVIMIITLAITLSLYLASAIVERVYSREMEGASL